MTTKPKYTAPEIIATHHFCDISEVRDNRYQPTLFPVVGVYSYGGRDYCCPTKQQKPPTKDRDGRDHDFGWKPVWTHPQTGRVVYESEN